MFTLSLEFCLICWMIFIMDCYDFVLFAPICVSVLGLKFPDICVSVATVFCPL